MHQLAWLAASLELNPALWGFLAMALLSALRLFYFARTFVRDGHRYRLPRVLRSCWPGDESEPLQPVTSAIMLLAQRKLEIHALVFGAMLVEVPVYAYGYTDQSSNNHVLLKLYPLHMLAYVLLYCAFAINVNIWVKFVDLEVRLRGLRCLLLFTWVLYVPLFVTGVVGCFQSATLGDFLVSEQFALFGWFSIITLLMLASGFFVVGIMLQTRICQVLGNNVATPDRRYYTGLCRLNLVMLCCTLCFLLRAAMFAVLMSSGPGRPEYSRVSGAWVLYAEWVPVIVPCLALLYLMRDSQKAGPRAMSSTSPDLEADVEMRTRLNV